MAVLDSEVELVRERKHPPSRFPEDHFRFGGTNRKINTHPVERMLKEPGPRQRCTRPFQPQTNGKVERFWAALGEDLLEGTTF